MLIECISAEYLMIEDNKSYVVNSKAYYFLGIPLYCKEHSTQELEKVQKFLSVLNNDSRKKVDFNYNSNKKQKQKTKTK